MIHDKDYILRIVRQFSNMLSKLLLGKNENEFLEFETTFNTQMSDVFKMNFEELSNKSLVEIQEFVNEKNKNFHADYYELLGHLFYLKGKEIGNKAFLEKSKKFYELYLEKSKIFSLQIVNRIEEIKINA